MLVLRLRRMVFGRYKTERTQRLESLNSLMSIIQSWGLDYDELLAQGKVHQWDATGNIFIDIYE